MRENSQLLQVMLTLLKRIIIQNASPSFLVGFVRETTLLIIALLSWRYKEFGFMVILFFNIVFQQPSSPSQVEPNHLAFGGHAGGKLSASIGHAKRKQSATTSHVDTIEKTSHSKCKLKFPCKLCKGDHLTH